MASFTRNRTSISSIADRLLVEKFVEVSGDVTDGNTQRHLNNFVTPPLLEDQKNNIFTVEQGLTTKVRKRVYMCRKSRSTEGGTHVCEVCGRMSFKVFPTTLEVIEGEKRASHLRKKENDVVQACRSCFIKNNGGHPNSSRIEANSIQPIFEHHPCGLPYDRASNSWHFIRREIILNKKNFLLNHKCNENWYRETLLSESRTANYSSSDDDTTYEDDDEFVCTKRTVHILPFQKEKKCTAMSSTKEFSIVLNNTRVKIPALEKRSSNELKTENLLEVDLSLDVNLINDKIISETSKKHDISQESLVEKNQTSNLPLDLTKNNRDVNQTAMSPTNVSSLEGSECDHLMSEDLQLDEHTHVGKSSAKDFTDNTSYCVKDESVDVKTIDAELTKRLLHNISEKIDIVIDNVADFNEDLFTKCIDGDPTDDLYHCLCDTKCQVRLLKNNAFATKVINNEKPVAGIHTSYRGVCKLVTLIRHNNGTYVESPNTSVYDSNGLPWKKQDLPFFIGASRRWKNTRRQKEKKRKEIDNLIASSPLTQRVRKKNDRHQNSTTIIGLSNDANINDIQSNVKTSLDDKLDEKSGDSKVISTYFEVLGAPNACAICNVNVQKSYSVFDRENVPLRLLKSFPKSSESIRVCMKCVSYDRTDSDKDLSSKELQNNDKRPFRKRGRAMRQSEDIDTELHPELKVAKVDINKRKQSNPKSIKTKPVIKKPLPLKTSDRKKSWPTRNVRFQADISKGNSTKNVATALSISSSSKKDLHSKSKITDILAKSTVEKSPEKIETTSIVTYSSDQSRTNKEAEKRLSNATESFESNAAKSNFVDKSKIPSSTSTPKTASPTINKNKQFNIKVVQKPNPGQLKFLTENNKTKYVIVQTTATSGGSTIQKLSTVAAGEVESCREGDIMINGKRYKIDTEFKLNDLVKDNEKAVLTSSGPHKDLIVQLPSILKRTIGDRSKTPTTYKIMNVVQGNHATDTTKIQFVTDVIKPASTQTTTIKSSNTLTPVDSSIASKSSSFLMSKSNPILRSAIPTTVTVVSNHSKDSPIVINRISHAPSTVNTAINVSNKLNKSVVHTVNQFSGSSSTSRKPATIGKTLHITDPALIKTANGIGFNPSQLNMSHIRQPSHTLTRPGHNLVIKQGNVTVLTTSNKSNSAATSQSKLTMSQTNKPGLNTNKILSFPLIQSTNVLHQNRPPVNTPETMKSLAPLNTTPLSSTITSSVSGVASQSLQ